MEDKIIIIDFQGRPKNVSVDLVKPAYLEADTNADADNRETVPANTPGPGSSELREQPEVSLEAHMTTGNVVNAKSHGFPPWPAVIIDPN